MGLLNRHRKALVAVALVLIAAIGIGAVLLQLPDSQSMVLSDGSRLEMTAATFGNRHFFGSPLLKLADSISPQFARSLSKWIPSTEVATHYTTTSTILFWITRKSETKDPFNNVRYQLTAKGMKTGAGPDYNLRTVSSRKGWISASVFTSWPRRHGQLDLVVLERNQENEWKESGRFSIPNPNVADAVPFTADFLPATNRSGSLETVLHGFASGTEVFGRNSGLYPSSLAGDQPESWFVLETRTSNGPDNSWLCIEAAVEDATGNRRVSDGGGILALPQARNGPVLWPGENAWKLTLSFKRKPEFTTNDFLVFSNIPIPPVNTTSHPELSASANGVTVVLHSFTRKPDPTNETVNLGSMTSLKLVLDEPDDGMEVDLVSIAIDGHEEMVKAIHIDRNPGTLLARFKSFPAGATHLTATYSVQKVHQVEYFVAPNWVTDTNGINFSAPDSAGIWNPVFSSSPNH